MCFCLIGCYDGKTDTYGENAVYAAEFRGEWIDMDSGDLWYIKANSLTVEGNASNLNIQQLIRTSESVIIAKGTDNKKYTLFASRIANASFNAQVVMLDSNSALSGVTIPQMIIRPVNQPDLTVTIDPDPVSGDMFIYSIIPGDPVHIFPAGTAWKDIKVEITPNWGVDQNMGIIPLTDGDNFKVSVKLEESTDITELYADMVPRTYIIELENIGKTNCGDGGWELSWDDNDFEYIFGSIKEDFTNIAPGEKRQLSVTLASKQIDTEYKTKDIKIDLWNYDSVSKQMREWEDSVSINYYYESVPFNFRSEKEIRGVIKVKNGKSYYFRTSRPEGSTGNFSATKRVPWSRDEYIIAFLGESIESNAASKYSFAIDALPPVNWESLTPRDFLRDFKPHNEFESSAPFIDLSSNTNSFMGYLAGDSIDYYKIKLVNTPPAGRIGTVIFDLNEANGTAPAPISRGYGVGITLPNQTGISKSGFIVDGWNTKADGTGTNYDAASSYTVNNDITLYANWLLLHTVTFNGNGETSGAAPAPMQEVIGKSIKIPEEGTLVKTGFVFDGWLIGFGETDYYSAGDSYPITGSTTLYAKWIPRYTVTFYGNGLTDGAVPAPMTAGQGKSIILPNQGTLVRTGYVFVSWNTSADGTGSNFNAGASVKINGNTSLYAVWAEARTITFNANGGSGTVSSITAADGSVITLPSSGFSRSGYTFNGWTTSGGTTYSAGGSYTVAGSAILYARWIQHGSIRITNNAYFYAITKIDIRRGSSYPSSSYVTGSYFSTFPYNNYTTFTDLPPGTYYVDVTFKDNYYPYSTVGYYWTVTVTAGNQTSISVRPN